MLSGQTVMTHSLHHKLIKATITLILIQLSITCAAQWNNIYIDSSLHELRDLSFLSKDTGFVCGYFVQGEGAILRTYDGGENWQNTISDILVCTSIVFVNDYVGYSGGQDGVVYKTTDGGITWEYSSSLQPIYDYEAMEFINDSVGFVKAYYGPLYKTTDGAQSWNPVSPIINSLFYEGKNHSIHFVDDSTGFVVGSSAIFKTIDQGDNWYQQNADSGYYYRAIYMINESEGFAVGNEGVFAQTIDGGSNWSTDSISDKNLLDIVFISDSIGFIIGNGGHTLNGPDTMGVILRTNDQGLTWEEFIICGHNINAISYVDSVAYIAGIYGYIFKNDNFSNLVDITNHHNYLGKIKVWPNPANNELHFSIPDKQFNELTLLDCSGRTILEYSNYPAQKIDISGIPGGLYILKISCDSKLYVNKVIIQ